MLQKKNLDSCWRTIIQTPTPNLIQSLNFYLKLGFTVLQKSESIFLSDGKVIIEINPNQFIRAGIKLYQKSWTNQVKQLETITNVLKIEKGYLLNDTSGSWLYLIETNTPPQFEIANCPPSVLGNCAGVSLETVDILKAIKIYNILGFTQSMGSLEQGWIALVNEDKFTVSLMQPNSCPHLFFNPSLTYFNGKNNLAIIKKIRQLNIPIIEEITIFNKKGIVDNVILRDLGGYGFFIFSD